MILWSIFITCDPCATCKLKSRVCLKNEYFSITVFHLFIKKDDLRNQSGGKNQPSRLCKLVLGVVVASFLQDELVMLRRTEKHVSETPTSSPTSSSSLPLLFIWPYTLPPSNSIFFFFSLSDELSVHLTPAEQWCCFSLWSGRTCLLTNRRQERETVTGGNWTETEEEESEERWEEEPGRGREPECEIKS